MKVNYERSLLKDLKKLHDIKIKNKLKTLFELFESSENINSIPNIKKLQGFSYYYRLRVSNYRLGFYYKNNTIDIICFIHRKDIYKQFP